MPSSSRNEAFRTLNTAREGHMNVVWCNQTQVVNYLFKYVTKGPDWVGSESVLESPPLVGSEEVVRYLFKYVTKSPDWVGSESVLESPPQVGSEELCSSVVADPNPPHAPSIATMTDKRLPSQRIQADAQFNKNN